MQVLLPQGMKSAVKAPGSSTWYPLKDFIGITTLTRIVGTKGTKDIVKDQARYFFGLKSNLFTPVLHQDGELEWVGERETDRLRDMEGFMEVTNKIFQQFIGNAKSGLTRVVKVLLKAF